MFQTTLKRDALTKEMKEMVYSMENAEFTIRARADGIKFDGNSLWIETPEQLNDFARFVAEAFKNHRIMLEKKMGQVSLKL